MAEPIAADALSKYIRDLDKRAAAGMHSAWVRLFGCWIEDCPWCKSDDEVGTFGWVDHG